jgi:hypothetical protein
VIPSLDSYLIVVVVTGGIVQRSGALVLIRKEWDRCLVGGTVIHPWFHIGIVFGVVFLRDGRCENDYYKSQITVSRR